MRIQKWRYDVHAVSGSDSKSMQLPVQMCRNEEATRIPTHQVRAIGGFDGDRLPVEEQEGFHATFGSGLLLIQANLALLPSPITAGRSDRRTKGVGASTENLRSSGSYSKKLVDA